MLVTDRTFAETCERLDRHQDLVWDLETTGLNPYLGDKTVGVVLGVLDDTQWVGPRQFYFPLRHAEGNLPPAAAPRLWQLIASRRHLIGHNSIAFDAQFAAYENSVCNQVLVQSDQVQQTDTIVLAMMDNENRPSYKLENLCAEFNPRAGDAEVQLLRELAAIGYRNKDAKKEMWRLHPTKVARYACTDIANTRDLLTYLTTRVSAQGLDPELLAEMMRYGRLLSRMRRYGVHMDRAGLQRQRTHTAAMEQELLAKIHQSAGFGINPRSPKQLGQWLGLKSTAKAALKASGDPRAEMLLNYRRASKAIGTYIDPIISGLDGDDVIHPQLNMTRDPRDVGGTRSGRLSCSNPNFQALPDPKRDPLNLYGIRRGVTPRKGNVLVGADYDRFEVFMAGAYSGDPYVEEFYRTGEDPYDTMAADLGITRDQAKVTFLSIQYGIGAWELGRTLGIGETAAWHVRQAWRERHPNIYRAMLKESEWAEATGTLRLWTGRLIHFDENLVETPRTKFYAAWNRRIQGSCAEVMRVAMQNLEQPLGKLGAEMVLQVHDELWAEGPEENAEKIRVVMRACMENFHEFDLRPRATPKIGMTGAELKG